MQFHEDKQDTPDRLNSLLKCSILRNLMFLINRNSHYYMYGKCSKITNTKKLLFFPLFVILEIRFMKKMLVFGILECGLYHEKKNGIYACQNVVETC